MRRIVDIPDALDDPELKDLGVLASGDVDTALFPFIGDDSTGTITVLEGDNLTLAENATAYKTASLWKAKKQNDKLASYYEKLYQSSLEQLITKLRSRRSSRTKRVSVSTDYVARPLFSQTKKF